MTRSRIFFSILATSLAFLMVVISIGSVAYASDDYEKYEEKVKQKIEELGKPKAEKRARYREAKEERYRKKLELAKKMLELIKEETQKQTEEAGGKNREKKEVWAGKYKKLKEMGKQYGFDQNESGFDLEGEGESADKTLEIACKRVRERYQERLERYKQVEKRYVARYGRAISYLEGTLTKLESLGVGTTEARGAFATFKEKIDEAVVSLRQNMTLLEGLKKVGCSEPEKVRNQMQLVREELKQTREKAQEARRFYKEELRPILLKLKG